MKTYDIIVVGGGISGSIAAIAAARLGTNVLLVEQYGFLGGMLTTAGVGPMMSFHAGNKQVVQGITGELIDRMVLSGSSPGHIFDSTGYTYTVTPFDAEDMKHQLEQMLLESGGKILYHSLLSKVVKNENLIDYISVSTKSGSIDLKAKVYMDATGDADLACMSGVGFDKGRSEDGACQPLTMNMKMTNVDIDRIKEYVRNNSDEFPRIQENINFIDKSSRLSLAGYTKSFEEARNREEISFERGGLLFFETNNPGEIIINTTRVLSVDPTDPWSFSQAEIQGRKQVTEIKNFLVNKISGFENALLMHSGPVQIGVRSSRQIQGLHTLNERELIETVKFDDVVAHGGYPIDIHPPEGKEEDDTGMPKKKYRLKQGAVYGIPYRSLLNNYVTNMITVGRCISATFVAQSAIRVSPIAGAIGHAGGVAAAIAIQQNKSPLLIDVKMLQRNLAQQGAYLEI